MTRGGTLLACAAALALVPAGCSGDSAPAEPPAGGDPEPRPASEPRAALEPARCPPDLAGCRTASGRIIYVERTDPDGDGDAHFVLISREAITGPGVSVIDVKPSLRPSPLPGPGDRISAAGPVYRGSYDQKQIEAVELHVARR